MLEGQTLFCYTALLIFITVSFVCGVIKFFHVCPPYKSDISYYYPVRKLIVVVYLSPLTLIPCLTCPYSADGWLYGRAFMLLGFGLPLIIATEKHYGRDTSMKKMKIEMGVLLALEIIGFVFSLLDKNILAGNMVTYYVIVGLLFVYMHLRVLATMHWLHGMIRDNMRDTFSSEEDLRSPFTHAVLWILIPFFIATAVAFVWNNKVVMSVVLLAVSVRFVAYLLITLSSVKAPRFSIIYDDDKELVVVPKSDLKNAEMYMHEPASALSKEEPVELVAAVNDAFKSLTTDEKPDIDTEREQQKKRNAQLARERHAERIAKLMTDEQLYLKAHLMVDDVAKALGVNSTYVREACKVNYDNFFDMVNSYRIEYAKTFSMENPNYSREAIALACGFGSYRSYLRAEEKYNSRNVE